MIDDGLYLYPSDSIGQWVTEQKRNFWFIYFSSWLAETLLQSVLEVLHSMERAHAGAVIEELQPLGRTHVGEGHEGLCSWEEPHAGAREEHEEEGAAETKGYGLTIAHIPHPPASVTG